MASVAKFFASLIFLPLGNLGRMVVKGLSSMRQLVPHLMIVLFLFYISSPKLKKIVKIPYNRKLLDNLSLNFY